MSPSYSSTNYYISVYDDFGGRITLTDTGSGIKLYRVLDIQNSDMGIDPSVLLYDWQYTIPPGSTMAFSIQNSGVPGISTTTMSTPVELLSANGLKLTLVSLTEFPESDFSGKGFLLNSKLYVDNWLSVATTEVLIGEEKITISGGGNDSDYGNYITFDDVTLRVTSSTLKCYPHGIGALVARTNYTATYPEALSPIAAHGIIINNQTVDGSITYGQLDTYVTQMLLGTGLYYKISQTWGPIDLCVVPEVTKYLRGNPWTAVTEFGRTRPIRIGDSISFTKFDGDTPEVYEVVSVVTKLDEGRILLELGDFEKNVYTSLEKQTNAINRTLT
jgi:hypothetical protein